MYCGMVEGGECYLWCFRFVFGFFIKYVYKMLGQLCGWIEVSKVFVFMPTF